MRLVVIIYGYWKVRKLLFYFWSKNWRIIGKNKLSKSFQSFEIFYGPQSANKRNLSLFKKQLWITAKKIFHLLTDFTSNWNSNIKKISIFETYHLHSSLTQVTWRNCWRRNHQNKCFLLLWENLQHGICAFILVNISISNRGKFLRRLYTNVMFLSYKYLHTRHCAEILAENKKLKLMEILFRFYTFTKYCQHYKQIRISKEINNTLLLSVFVISVF